MRAYLCCWPADSKSVFVLLTCWQHEYICVIELLTAGVYLCCWPVDSKSVFLTCWQQEHICVIDLPTARAYLCYWPVDSKRVFMLLTCWQQECVLDLLTARAYLCCWPVDSKSICVLLTCWQQENDLPASELWVSWWRWLSWHHCSVSFSSFVDVMCCFACTKCQYICNNTDNSKYIGPRCFYNRSQHFHHHSETTIVCVVFHLQWLFSTKCHRYALYRHLPQSCELVWPSGKASGW